MMNSKLHRLELAHAAKAEREYDEMCERQDAQQAKIDTMVEDQWKDTDYVAEILEENLDIVALLLTKLNEGVISRDDYAERMLSSCDHWITNAVENIA